MRRDTHTFGGAQRAGAHRDRDVGDGIAIVADVYGDQIASAATGAEGQRARVGGDDRQVGQALVAVDPVFKEPSQIALAGLLDGLLERCGIAVELRIEGKRMAEGGERLAEQFAAEQLAQLPEDECGF